MVIIRPETPADYAALNDVHIQAFDNRFGEAALVALLRTRKMYDVELSLVAEIDGQVVGHAMFNPMQVYLNGERVQAVNLAPLAIHPDFQKQGIGGKLMEQGHQNAQKKEVDFAFLLGHTDYYPRFAYQTGAYGVSSLTVPTASLADIALETTKPLPDDIATLANLQQANESQVNLSAVPEDTLAEWLSPNSTIPCTVYQHEGELVGYTRGTRDNVRQFLARDAEMARGIAKHLAGDAAEIILPLHPLSLCASAFDEVASVKVWAAAMICPLRADALVWDYLKDIDNGGLVGRVIWSSIFDIA